MKVALDQIRTAQWSQLPPMQSQREGGAAVAIHGSKILVVGGYHAQKKFLKSCAVFDLNTKEWSDYPPMKTARMGCAAVFLEQHNSVVVVGGFQRGRKYLNTVEYLDLSTQRWHRLPPMSTTRAGCAAVTVLGKRVVVLGGWMDGETASGSVEVLDFNAQQWHTLPEMATPRAGCSAAAIGHRVLVLGGHTTSGKHRGCRNSVEVLDLSTQKWTRLPNMKEKRDASASCTVGNCVLVLGGGETSTAPSSTVEILDFDTQTWKELPRMRFKRFGCSAAAIGNKIVVLGGRGEDGQHLETVECLQLPIQDATVATPSLGNFLDNQPVPAATNGDAKSLAETYVTMMEHDKSRIRSNYDASKKQAQEMFERTISSLEERLRIIDKEREKIQEHIKKARADRDESVAKAERERREATAALDSKIQQSKASAAALPSSAPENLVSNEADELEPPSELCCCITGDLMDDPVTAMDGHTYERSAIEAWFSRFDASQSPTSPLTNEALPSRRLIPSHNIRSQCKTWKEKLGLDKEEAIADPLAGLTNGDNKSHQNSPAVSRGVQRQPSSNRNSTRGISNSEHGPLTPTPSANRRSLSTQRSTRRATTTDAGTRVAALRSQRNEAQDRSVRRIASNNPHRSSGQTPPPRSRCEARRMSAS